MTNGHQHPSLNWLPSPSWLHAALNCLPRRYWQDDCPTQCKSQDANIAVRLGASIVLNRFAGRQTMAFHMTRAKPSSLHRERTGPCQEPTLADNLSGVPAEEDRHGDPHPLKISVPRSRAMGQSYGNASRRVSAGFLVDCSSAGCDQFPGIGHAPVGCGCAARAGLTTSSCWRPRPRTCESSPNWSLY
jgi:hypothetical protein